MTRLWSRPRGTRKTRGTSEEAVLGPWTGRQEKRRHGPEMKPFQRTPALGEQDSPGQMRGWGGRRLTQPGAAGVTGSIQDHPTEAGGHRGRTTFNVYGAEISG